MERAIVIDGKAMEAKTSSLNQDLANVDVIFSDKTANEMAFVSSFIRGKYYEKHVDLSDFSGGSASVKQFLICLAINNSIYVKEKERQNTEEDFEDKEEEDDFEGENSDEIALMKYVSKKCQTILKLRTQHEIRIRLRGKDIVYRVILTIPFTSARKRMTVVVQNMETGDMFLYIKGSDDELYKRASERSRRRIGQYENAVYAFARMGFRILVIGCKRIKKKKEFIEFLKNEYSPNLNEEEFIADLNDRIVERDIEILGITAIEDRLAEGVPEAIRYLKSAGIAVHVLTGDKVETAINVCYGAKVLRKNQENIEILLTGKGYNNDLKDLRMFVNKLLRFLKNNYRKDYIYHLILDNVSLNDLVIHHEEQLMEMIKEYINGSLICCRVSPKQKAILVELTQNHLKKNCLAIGDGANDVLMIQKSDIGIGILGKEGTQASRSSDYALPSFRNLIDLVAIEGRYSYIRNSDLILMCFYKNVYISVCLILYTFFNGLSATVFVDSMILSLYNTLFHGFPPFVIGVFEKDIDEKIIRNHPSLYKSLKKERFYFSNSRILYFFFLAIFQGIMTFFLFYFINYNARGGFYLISRKSMIPLDLNVWGHLITTNVMVVVYLVFCIETKNWTFITFITLVLSFFSYVIYVYVCGMFTLYSPLFFMIPHTFLDSLNSFLESLFVIAMNFLPVFIFKYVEQNFLPRDWQKILKLAKKEEIHLNKEFSIRDKEIIENIINKRNVKVKIDNYDVKAIQTLSENNRKIDFTDLMGILNVKKRWQRFIVIKKLEKIRKSIKRTRMKNAKMLNHSLDSIKNAISKVNPMTKFEVLDKLSNLKEKIEPKIPNLNPDFDDVFNIIENKLNFSIGKNIMKKAKGEIKIITRDGPGTYIKSRAERMSFRNRFRKKKGGGSDSSSSDSDEDSESDEEFDIIEGEGEEEEEEEEGEEVEIEEVEEEGEEEKNESKEGDKNEDILNEEEEKI